MQQLNWWHTTNDANGCIWFWCIKGIYAKNLLDFLVSWSYIFRSDLGQNLIIVPLHLQIDHRVWVLRRMVLTLFNMDGLYRNLSTAQTPFWENWCSSIAVGAFLLVSPGSLLVGRCSCVFMSSIVVISIDIYQVFFSDTIWFKYLVLLQISDGSIYLMTLVQLICL